ncbi:hypothetical protein KDH_11170 [Dictyobacter sp. S3.2.2.5]|uniref:DUF2232 domain-containing protein n=1 Tax=Dictyobacter halimunensis TaxID=3026934 RepID=A0ABQ6FP08_9CHLR|nr:hypothetical protein KDH_11170 [Dictyobacter sp. S3.2.2.5]
MGRTLQAIEIAEGALLADIAVVLRFIALVMPAGSVFFSVFNVIIFAVLVLRRGLYVAAMGMGVAVFLAAIVMGPHALVFLFLEGCGGMFLGIAMKRRWAHGPVLLLGIFAGALACYALVMFLLFFTGLTVQDMVGSVQQTLNGLLALLGQIAAGLGHGLFWQQQISSPVNGFITWGVSNWMYVLYPALCVVLCPIVIAIYLVTNASVRRLGYDVRPFPGPTFRRWSQRIRYRRLKSRIQHRKVREGWS